MFLEMAKPQKRWSYIEIELEIACLEHDVLFCVTYRVDAFIGGMFSLTFHSLSGK